MKRKKAGEYTEVAVDWTRWVYKGGRAQRLFTFASISMLQSGKRTPLMRLLIGPQDQSADILKQLLQHISKNYTIQRVYIDRFFFTSEALKVLHSLHLKYIIPCPHYSKIQQIIDVSPAPCIIKNIPYKDTKFNLIIAAYKNKRGNIVKKTLATNEDINETDIDAINEKFSHNSIHWEIKVSFESIKNSTITTNDFDYFYSTIMPIK